MGDEGEGRNCRGMGNRSETHNGQWEVDEGEWVLTHKGPRGEKGLTGEGETPIRDRVWG